MGDLLKEIQLMFPKAAEALTKAGFVTDSDIRSLTREDLNELLPGSGDFDLRKDVFEMIQKSSPPNMPQKEVGELQNKLASCAVMGDLLKEIYLMFPKAADVLTKAGLITDSDIRSLTREDLNELLPGAGDFRLRKNVFETIQKSSQLTSSEIPPNDNVDPLKNNNTRQPDSKDDEGAVMGDLWKEIHIKFQKAADALKQAGFETDSDIRSLTREDLNELLPGVEDLRLRKDVYNMIHIPRPANMLLKELGELRNNLASSAQIDSGVSMDHIRFITEQLVIVQVLLNDNVDLLKKINTWQPDSKADKDRVKIEAPQMSPSPAMDSSSDLDGSQDASGSNRKCNSFRVSNARTSAYKSQEVTVKYKMVVRGKTFDAHTQLMDEVKRATKGDVRLLENSQESQIIIVFCPITSRVESDVKAVMSGVPGDKPVILVKMHHVYESKPSLCLNTLIDDRNNVVQVNVFYHENFPGLLKCQLNEKAVYEIQKELLKHSDHRSKEARARTSGQDPENKAKKGKKS